MEKVFKVEGMTCQHCKSSVEEAVNGIANVSGQVDLENKLLTVQMEQDQTAKIIAAVEDIGFDIQ